MSNVKTIIEHNGVEYTAHVATINSTYLGNGEESRGTFSYSLDMRWNSSGIGAGGYCLDTPVKDDDGKRLGREGTAFGLDHIIRILETVGVESWEKVKGSKVWLLFPAGGGWGSTCSGIANLDKPEKVLIFKEHAQQWLDREAAAEIDAASAAESITISREQAEYWAQRKLTDDEFEQLGEAIPNSSVPDAVATIVDGL